MKALTAAEARSLALEDGAELEIDGKRFNTNRTEVTTERPEPPSAEVAPPPAAPQAPADQPAPEMLTRADVAAMLSERDAVWRSELRGMAEAFRASVAALSAAAKTQEPPRIREWTFETEYDRHDRVVTTRATPTYEA